MKCPWSYGFIIPCGLTWDEFGYPVVIPCGEMVSKSDNKRKLNLERSQIRIINIKK